jgi:hypothetical protein
VPNVVDFNNDYEKGSHVHELFDVHGEKLASNRFLKELFAWYVDDKNVKDTRYAIKCLASLFGEEEKVKAPDATVEKYKTLVDDVLNRYPLIEKLYLSPDDTSVLDYINLCDEHERLRSEIVKLKAPVKEANE